MQSFTLKTSTWTLEERFKLFKDLYAEVLNDDENWHFFYEAEAGDFLRVSDEYMGLVSDYLEQYDTILMYEHTGEWEEHLPFVAQNMGYFAELFHLNTIFSLTYVGDKQYLYDNLYYWIDRYSHSLHDMLQLTFNGRIMETEGSNLSRATVARAWFDGYRFGYLKFSSKLDTKDKDVEE